MAALDRGLYEVLITEAFDAQLSRLGDRLQAIRGDLRAAEAADRIGASFGACRWPSYCSDRRERTNGGRH